MTTLLQKPATFLLESLGKILWGFKPNLMASIVEQRGPTNALVWFVKNMPQYERILKEWGPIRTHFISVGVSTLNGCPYCVYGHAYALQLHYLKNTNQLFPIDETEIINLNRKKEGEIMAQFERVLSQAGLDEEIPYLQRMVELYHDATAASSTDDKYLLHLINMFSLLNACGIAANAKADEAHDPINKDLALRQRYATLRGGAAA